MDFSFWYNILITSIMGKHKELWDGMGIVYLATNDIYQKENTYKVGSTMNFYKRKSIQENWVPPTHRIQYKITLFSTRYKEIEKWLKKIFKESKVLLVGDCGGKEWVQCDFDKILEKYKEALIKYPSEKSCLCLCEEGKAYRVRNGKINESNRWPNFRLDILGVTDKEKVKCMVNGKCFNVNVRKNKIIDDGSEITLSGYMKKHYPRKGDTNEQCGSQYFSYKGVLISDLWQNLAGVKWKKNPPKKQ